MGAFARGDVVTVPFPFSKVPGEKVRPALILAGWQRGSGTDYLFCMITTQSIVSPHVVDLDTPDITGGVLRVKSYVRPTYVHVADEVRIVRKVGVMTAPKVQECLTLLTSVLK